MSMTIQKLEYLFALAPDWAVQCPWGINVRRRARRQNRAAGSRAEQPSITDFSLRDLGTHGCAGARRCRVRLTLRRPSIKNRSTSSADTVGSFYGEILCLKTRSSHANSLRT